MLCKAERKPTKTDSPTTLEVPRPKVVVKHWIWYPDIVKMALVPPNSGKGLHFLHSMPSNGCQTETTSLRQMSWEVPQANTWLFVGLVVIVGYVSCIWIGKPELRWHMCWNTDVLQMHLQRMLPSSQPLPGAFPCKIDERVFCLPFLPRRYASWYSKMPPEIRYVQNERFWVS